MCNQRTRTDNNETDLHLPAERRRADGRTGSMTLALLKLQHAVDHQVRSTFSILQRFFLGKETNRFCKYTDNFAEALVAVTPCY